jgi:hypothetical protein
MIWFESISLLRSHLKVNGIFGTSRDESLADMGSAENKFVFLCSRSATRDDPWTRLSLSTRMQRHREIRCARGCTLIIVDKISSQNYRKIIARPARTLSKTHFLSASRAIGERGVLELNGLGERGLWSVGVLALMLVREE